MRWLFFAILFSLLSSASAYSAPLRVLVTVPSYREIVEGIGKEEVEVREFIPENVDLHAFEPTPHAMDVAATSDLWFMIGEPFETKVKTVLQEYGANITAIDLRDSIPREQEKMSYHYGKIDPHIWMSPLLMLSQAKTICDALTEKRPEKKQFFEQNFTQVEQRLHGLNLRLQQLFQGKEQKTVLVVHAAFGYFCSAYHLQQLVIEHEGKEPTPKSLDSIIEKAHALGITEVFYQNAHGEKIATLVAEKLGGQAVFLTTLSPHFFEMCETIGMRFAEGCR